MDHEQMQRFNYMLEEHAARIERALTEHAERMEAVFTLVIDCGEKVEGPG